MEQTRELERIRFLEESQKTQEDEDSAWSKVTPLGTSRNSPESTRHVRNRSNGKMNSFLKPGNYSEGEQSDNDEVEVLSAGKRSNYTNTSVCVVANGDDASS